MQKTSRLIPIVYVFFLLGVLEAALRIQQSTGPLYDLNFTKFIQANNTSPTVNHIPSPAEPYNTDGIQISEPKGPDSRFEPGTVKILFMGDSFMQGYPPQATIPEFLRAFLKKERSETPFVLWNAGYSSYAPLIYEAQARELIPRYQPDFLILSLDETDLIDDFALYHPWTQKNSSGEVIAVNASEPNRIKLEGYQLLREIPFYTLRLLGMWALKIKLYFVFENYRKEFKGKYYTHPLADTNRRHSFNLAHIFDEDPGSDVKYRPEIRSFEIDLDGLFSALKKLMKDPKKILIITHPHPHHLTPDTRGILWKKRVAEIAARQARKHEIAFFDSADELQKQFGENPEDFYIPGDMHFNERGFELYAQAVGKVILSRFTNQKENLKAQNG